MCLQEIKCAAYCTLIRHQLEYASTERVQKKAARFVANEYSLFRGLECSSL